MLQYLEIEQRLQQFIYTVYGLSDLTEHECSLIKEIDDDMLAYEMITLLHSNDIRKGKLVGQHNLQFVIMNEVENEFVSLVEELQNLNMVTLVIRQVLDQQSQSK